MSKFFIKIKEFECSIRFFCVVPLLCLPDTRITIYH